MKVNEYFLNQENSEFWSKHLTRLVLVTSLVVLLMLGAVVGIKDDEWYDWIMGYLSHISILFITLLALFFGLNFAIEFGFRTNNQEFSQRKAACGFILWAIVQTSLLFSSVYSITSNL